MHSQLCSFIAYSMPDIEKTLMAYLRNETNGPIVGNVCLLRSVKKYYIFLLEALLSAGS